MSLGLADPSALDDPQQEGGVSRVPAINANTRATGCMARIEQCVVVPEQEREL
jgi:hypothetical protein